MVLTSNTNAVSSLPLSSVSESTVPGRLLKWCSKFREGSKPEHTYLFCFPFAGGGASAYADWVSSFPEHIAIAPVQYPGRETRWSEPQFATLTAMVEAMAEDFAGCWPNQFAFFGHSYGALVAYELTRTLKDLDQPLPLRLFVSGAPAPHLPLRERIHDLPDDLFLAKLREYNGLPDEVLQHADLLATVLPMIREDFRLFEEHEHGDNERLTVPLSVFGGLGDASVSVEELLPWARHTNKAFRSRFLKGSHFFLFDSVSIIAASVQQDLAACSPRAGG